MSRRTEPPLSGQTFYVTNEAELKTWAFKVGSDGTLTEPKLFVQEGGENVAVDARGNVYIAAGQILVFDPSGKHIETIGIPQRPTCLVFGGRDRGTLFITARSSLYSVQIRFAEPISDR
jgi:sugar lactone lactonase YvrE